MGYLWPNWSGTKYPYDFDSQDEVRQPYFYFNGSEAVFSGIVTSVVSRKSTLIYNTVLYSVVTIIYTFWTTIYWHLLLICDKLLLRRRW